MNRRPESTVEPSRNRRATDAPDDPVRLFRVRKTWEEIQGQGEAIRRSLSEEAERVREVAERIHERDVDRIILVGCGDSWYAGLGVKLTMRKILGVHTEVVQALDYALYDHLDTDDQSVVIAASSSGTTGATLNAVEVARTRGALTVGLTNTEGSPIAESTDLGLLARATRVGWPTQSTTTAMSLLLALTLNMAERLRADGLDDRAERLRQGLDGLGDLVEQITEKHDQAMKALAGSIAEVRWLAFTGAGPYYSVAHVGSGKVRELSPIHATSYPLEEFHHYRSAKEGDYLFLVVPDEASHPRALDTARSVKHAGGELVALVPEEENEIAELATHTVRLPPSTLSLAPITYLVPLHLFAYYLAEAKFERGLGYPGAFPNGG